MVEVRSDGLADELENVALLLTTGFDGRQQRFHEAAAGGALRSEGEFSPDHRVTQG